MRERSGTGQQSKNEGFSLTELLIVLLCAAILAGAAVPNIPRLKDTWELWGSVRGMEASLQWGRMQAIARNTPIEFTIDNNMRKYCWTDPASGDPYQNSIRHLPRGIRIASCPKRPLRFYQHGNAAPAGTFRLEGSAGSWSVVVSPGGRIRLQKN